MPILEPMHVSTPEAAAPRRIEVFTGTGRRRACLPDEKAAFVAESHSGGYSPCGNASTTLQRPPRGRAVRFRCFESKSWERGDALR